MPLLSRQPRLHKPAEQGAWLDGHALPCQSPAVITSGAVMKPLLAILDALSDPTRLRIFLLVREMQLSMGELADILGQSQPRVSRHVRLLSEAGLVRRRKEGAWVFVDVDERAPVAEINALAARVAAGRDLIAAEHARLGEVRSERQRVLDCWFAEKAGEWDLVSRLGGQEREVEAALAAAARQPAVGRLLDIGTGTGLVLGLLAGDAESAIGIDRSPEMLRLARAKLSQDGRQMAELQHADMRNLPFADASFDTVTLSQVLHFVDDPAGVVLEAARVLAPGGKLLIAEFAPHGHEELRERFHHARLGFEENVTLGWLESAGLCPRVVSRHPGSRLQVYVTEGRKPPASAG